MQQFESRPTPQQVQDHHHYQSANLQKNGSRGGIGTFLLFLFIGVLILAAGVFFAEPLRALWLKMTQPPTPEPSEESVKPKPIADKLPVASSPKVGVEALKMAKSATKAEAREVVEVKPDVEAELEKDAADPEDAEVENLPENEGRVIAFAKEKKPTKRPNLN